MTKLIMKEAAVFTYDNNSEYLKDLGMSTSDKYLCVYRKPTRIFNFQLFDMHQFDIKKVYDYMKTKDGIIIIHNINKYDKMEYEATCKILNNFPNKPIMVVIEKSNSKNLYKSIKETENHKEFVIEKQNYIISESSKQWFEKQIASCVKPKEEPKYTSQTMPTDLLIKKFKNSDLELSQWDHFGRLKIVHYFIITYGYDNTINPNGFLCTYWKKYKDSIGHGHLWHYTLTRFWINILYNIQKKHNYTSFEELYKNHTKIQSGKLFKEYYTDEILFTEYARNNWIEPNIIK
jgi:hypothetical protein